MRAWYIRLVCELGCVQFGFVPSWYAYAESLSHVTMLDFCKDLIIMDRNCSLWLHYYYDGVVMKCNGVMYELILLREEYKWRLVSGLLWLFCLDWW